MLFNNPKQYIAGMILLIVACSACADPYVYDPVCPTGPNGITPGGSVYGGYWDSERKFYVDKWRFAQCNCTSYVANRINMNGIVFNNASFGQHWGDAEHWDDAAQDAGILVDASPAVGSIAQWNDDEIRGGYGHVAYVNYVFRNEDGSIASILISQYNVSPNDYSEQILQPSDAGYPPRFIHFEQMRIKDDIGWFPPVTSCQAASQWFIIRQGSDQEAYKAGTSDVSHCPMMCVSN